MINVKEKKTLLQLEAVTDLEGSNSDSTMPRSLQGCVHHGRPEKSAPSLKTLLLLYSWRMMSLIRCWNTPQKCGRNASRVSNLRIIAGPASLAGCPGGGCDYANFIWRHLSCPVGGHMTSVWSLPAEASNSRYLRSLRGDKHDTKPSSRGLNIVWQSESELEAALLHNTLPQAVKSDPALFNNISSNNHHCAKVCIKVTKVNTIILAI